MSVAASLPQAISAGIAEIVTVTAALLQAVEHEDSAAIECALDQRAEMIERLEPHVVAFRERSGKHANVAMASAASELYASADNAKIALNQFRKKYRGILERLVQDTQAIRSYGTTLPVATQTLDRSS